MVTWSARRCVKHSNKNPDGNDDDTRLITLGASTRAASDWPAYLNYTPTTAAPRTTVPPSTSLATVEPALFHEGSSVSGQDTTTRPITDTKSSEQQHDGDEFFWVANTRRSTYLRSVAAQHAAQIHPRYSRYSPLLLSPLRANNTQAMLKCPSQ